LGETSRRGDTLLMVAAAWNHPELVTYLIERRLDVNARNNLGQTALMLASDGSATYPNPEDESRVSDKQDAYVKTQLALIDLLLAQGADPSFKDKAGLSLLHYATKGFETPQGFCWQPASIAEALATKALKVDLDARDPLGRTVLMNAVFANGAGLLESLLKQGANPNLQDLDGNYALLGLVTRSCQVEAKYGLVSYDAIDHADFKKKVELLLARGADYKLVNKAGKSALSEASEVFKSKNAN
ncbi:MAG: ankyrin repeat domain-containing protein, partial [Candidatus Sericytochromatia bacterium]